jgi:general secretion pathway protein G
MTPRNAPVAQHDLQRTTRATHVVSQKLIAIELVIVVLVIGTVATLVGARVFRSVERDRKTLARERIGDLESALDLYRLDIGRYPTTQEGLHALVARPSSAENWDGPYLKDPLLTDPWGRLYAYRAPGEHSDYDLLSFGSDGQEGGEREAADIHNGQ